MEDLFITKRINTIESLKSEALYKMADIFRYGGDDSKHSAIADLIVILYILADKMGYSYQKTDDCVINGIKTRIKAGESEWHEELSILLRHFEDGFR